MSLAKLTGFLSGGFLADLLVLRGLGFRVSRADIQELETSYVSLSSFQELHTAGRTTKVQG